MGHAKGAAQADLVLVEYADFQCPYCATAAEEVRRLQDMLGSRLRYEFRHFPLTEIHEHAQIAAEAAEAAGAQGKFWEMHDLLFDNQRDLEPPALLAYARKLGLDVRQFAEALDVERYVDAVQRDLESGARQGVRGTPTFFVNGQRHTGPSTAEGLLAAVDAGEAAGY